MPKKFPGSKLVREGHSFWACKFYLKLSCLPAVCLTVPVMFAGKQCISLNTPNSLPVSELDAGASMCNTEKKFVQVNACRRCRFCCCCCCYSPNVGAFSFWSFSTQLSTCLQRGYPEARMQGQGGWTRRPSNRSHLQNASTQIHAHRGGE